MKKMVLLLSVALLSAVAQPALADGRGHHHGCRGYGWLPLDLAL